MKADKGNQVVVMNRKDYSDKLNAIVSDQTKFKPIVADQTQFMRCIEKKVQTEIQKVVKQGGLSDDVFSSIYPSGTSFGRLYGLPKTHKANVPLRPILSAINTPTYQLAKFFVPILQQISCNDYTLKDTTNFLERLKAFDIKANHFMASLDVESLFTNIPLDETINICLKKLFDDEGISNISNLNKSQFKTLLELAVKECYFLRDCKIYKQVDGVANGEPFGSCAS